MKAMWCSDGGVSAVTVHQNADGADVAQGSDGAWWMAKPGTIHETEAEAKRAWFAAEVSKLDYRLVRIDNEMDELQVEFRRVKGEVDALTKDREQVIKGRAALVRQISETYATEGRR